MKNGQTKVHVAEMCAKMDVLSHKDRVRNENIRKNLRVASIRENQGIQFKIVCTSAEKAWIWCGEGLVVQGTGRRGRPIRTLEEVVRKDMLNYEVTINMKNLVEWES